MVLLLFAKGRQLLLKDSKKLFRGIKIGKTNLYIGAGMFLVVSAESGRYARKHLPSYSHFGTVEVLVLHGTGLGNRSVRVVLAAEAERHELPLTVGYRADFDKLRQTGASYFAAAEREANSITLPLRHAEPQLRLLVFGPRRGWRSWFQQKDELFGYCQVPLELLCNDEQYIGDLHLYHPVSHLQAGKLTVQVRYKKDESKLRLSYVAPRDIEPVTELDSAIAVDEHVSRSIDLMALLQTAQSVGEKLEEIREQLALWWGWEHPLRSMFTAGVLALVAVRPQFTGIWFHTVFSTAMLCSCARHVHPDVYDTLRPIASYLGVDAKQVDLALDDWIPQAGVINFERPLAEGMASSAKGEGGLEKKTQGNSLQMSSSRWLILRTAEYAGWLKPLGPILLTFDSLLAEIRRIALWEDVQTAAAVTCASIALGITSSYVRMTKLRPTTWVSGAMSLSVLATAPWMASGGTLSGSWSYFGHAWFGVGSFPKITSLEDVNRIQPWTPGFHSAKAWNEVLTKDHR